jgi:hypothetical protein
MDAVFEMMMKFRFFYSNLPVLLDKNPCLREKYVEVQQSIADRVSQLLLSLREANMMTFDDDQLSDIVSILRIVNTFWLSFYQTQHVENDMSDAVFYQGVLKILVIIRPYITANALPEFLTARDLYQQKFEQASAPAYA